MATKRKATKEIKSATTKVSRAAMSVATGENQVVKERVAACRSAIACLRVTKICKQCWRCYTTRMNRSK
jgi:hypothetical protein